MDENVLDENVLDENIEEIHTVEELPLSNENNQLDDTLNEDLVLDDLDIDNELDFNLENVDEVENNEEIEVESKIEIENLDTMTLKELKVICKNINIKAKGNKEDIIKKIKDKLVD